MFNALLLYTQEDAYKNELFINSFISEGQKHNCNIELVTHVNGLHQNVDFVINRSRDYFIAKSFEEEGIRVFNDSETTRIANDKWETYEYLKDKVPMAETKLPTEESPFGYPVIIKPRHGHGGNRVTRALNYEDYYSGCEYARDYMYHSFSGYPEYDSPIIQREQTISQDLRVYVIGSRIIASVLRTSENDFRSNYTLGGKARLIKPDKTITDMVEKICACFKFSFAGIDFIPDKNGDPILNEIEDCAGSRMLYSLDSDINIPKLYLEEIMETL